MHVDAFNAQTTDRKSYPQPIHVHPFSIDFPIKHRFCPGFIHVPDLFPQESPIHGTPRFKTQVADTQQSFVQGHALHLLGPHGILIIINYLVYIYMYVCIKYGYNHNITYTRYMCVCDGIILQFVCMLCNVM